MVLYLFVIAPLSSAGMLLLKEELKEEVPPMESTILGTVLLISVFGSLLLSVFYLEQWP
jgi:hypothetical protein